MEKELALTIKFRTDDAGIDRFLEMLEAAGMQFSGGGAERIILGYEDGEEEVPPAIVSLFEAIMKDSAAFGGDMFGYIRNKSRQPVTAEQKQAIEDWLDRNVENFEMGRLVDVWDN